MQTRYESFKESIVNIIIGYEMKFKIKDGMRVSDEGDIVINNTMHHIYNGYVVCDPSLNSKSWNTTKELNKCDKCLKYKKEQRNKRHNMRVSNDK